MSLFYDPKKKKVQPWVYIVLICIPIILVAGIIAGSKKKVEKRKLEKAKQDQADVFDRL